MELEGPGAASQPPPLAGSPPAGPVLAVGIELELGTPRWAHPQPPAALNSLRAGGQRSTEPVAASLLAPSSPGLSPSRSPSRHVPFNASPWGLGKLGCEESQGTACQAFVSFHATQKPWGAALAPLVRPGPQPSPGVSGVKFAFPFS